MIIISKLYHVNLDTVFIQKEKKTNHSTFNEILQHYTVKKGDTLYKIAKNHLRKNNINPHSINLTSYIHNLAKLNNIKNPDKIFIGQKLIFPDINDKIIKEATFIPPLKGIITSKYGMRIDPFTKHMRFHEGVDIGAPIGTPIHAAKTGKVIYSGYERGYGNIVIIKHSNNMITKYAHASKLLVKKGDMVKQGDVIALVGSTGRSTGPHLHFEVRINNKSVNPLKFIKL